LFHGRTESTTIIIFIASAHFRFHHFLFIGLSFLHCRGIHRLGHFRGQSRRIAKRTRWGFFLLWSHLQITLGTYIRLTALSHVDLPVMQKANGTLVIGAALAPIRAPEARRQPSVRDQSSNGAIVPLTRLI
jgi:hypothetical protein